MLFWILNVPEEIILICLLSKKNNNQIINILLLYMDPKSSYWINEPRKMKFILANYGWIFKNRPKTRSIKYSGI